MARSFLILLRTASPGLCVAHREEVPSVVVKSVGGAVPKRTNSQCATILGLPSAFRRRVDFVHSALNKCRRRIFLGNAWWYWNIPLSPAGRRQLDS